MAKKDQKSEKNEDIGDVPQSPLLIHKQYLKDMSFENPNAPQILLQTSPERPEMDMNILLDVQKLDNPDHENYYEVILTLSATATKEDQTMFLAEIIYAATASIHGLKEQQHHPLLFVEVPHMIFPFARQILANATQAGGYMPLQVRPVDFRSMYLKRFANGKKGPQAQKNENDKKAAS